MGKETSSQDLALKQWRFFVIFWPLLCFVLAGIILCQSGLEIEKRIVGAGFAIQPQIFFIIGMRIRRRLLKERRYATVLTTATVISAGRETSVSGGYKRIYYPMYEFQIGNDIYQVKSPVGYSNSCASKGQKVDLYYNPQNPKVFYVPIMQKRDNRWSILLCGIGIVYPIIGMLYSQLSFLP